MRVAWSGHGHLEVLAYAVGDADGGALGAGDLARDLVLGVARDAGAVDFEDDVIHRLPAARRDGEEGGERGVQLSVVDAVLSSCAYVKLTSFPEKAAGLPGTTFRMKTSPLSLKLTVQPIPTARDPGGEGGTAEFWVVLCGGLRYNGLGLDGIAMVAPP